MNPQVANGGRLVRVREREQRGKGGGVGGGVKVKMFHCLTREGVKRITIQLYRSDRSCIPVRPVFPWQLRVEVQKMFLLE